MTDPRWPEWTEDDRRDRAAAKRAGFDSVDEWVDAIDDAAEILKEANENTTGETDDVEES